MFHDRNTKQFFILIAPVNTWYINNIVVLICLLMHTGILASVRSKIQHVRNICAVSSYR